MSSVDLKEEMCLQNIPNSKLKTYLINKAKIKPHIYANLLADLQKLIDRISKEVSQIDKLFSEYTPHDENYHLSHLISIADTLLGEERYEKMTAAELYILIAALYGHDWGMAVSKQERLYIATSKIEKTNSEEIFENSDDCIKFKNYIKKNKIDKEIKSDEDIDLYIWQEYIRQTHAHRSAHRVKQFFSKIDGGVADCVSKACEGHYLDMKDITEYHGYYQNTSILGERVNLKAITIYVRLIDLFDLSDDRTPYIIWKYVNPQNRVSKMEWEKHRSLRPITINEVKKTIQVSGSTDDHEVYAALEDLKNLCNMYLEECNDALAYMNDGCHKPLYPLEWQVKAVGFKPISVQFEFDRPQLMKILSDEIYDNTPYTFIRELLQNSIDAIEMRKAVLIKNRIQGTELGRIDVRVIKENEEINIFWEDDGVGMDEYVIKNYLSVLGRSYYTSEEFANEEYNFHPISKFGIGILSCFVISEEMVINTKREPYINNSTTGLRLKIPNPLRRFRIEENTSNLKIGTQIHLKLKEEKIKQVFSKFLRYNTEDINFEITPYLCSLAGYVKYPILIEENNMRIAIISPTYGLEKFKKNIDDWENYEIKMIEYDIPFSKIFLPKDIENAHELFKCEVYDLKDLKMENLEGHLNFIVLRDNFIDFKEGIVNSQKSIKIQSNEKNELIQVNSDWKIRNYYNKRRNYELYIDKPFKIYNDGIWIEDVYLSYFGSFGYIDSLESYNMNLPVPRISINLKDLVKDEMSVSRFCVNTNENIEQILQSVWKQLCQFVAPLIENEIKEMSPNQKLFILAKKMVELRITLRGLQEWIDYSTFELPFILSNGDVKYELLEDEKIYVIPNYLAQTILPKYKENMLDPELKFDDWEHEKCLICNYSFDIDNNNDPIIASKVIDFITYWVEEKYILNSINVKKDKNISIIEEWKKKQIGDYTEISDDQIDEQLELLLSDLDYNDMVNSQILSKLLGFGRLNIVSFTGHSSNSFAAGFTYINKNHPITKEIIKIILSFNKIYREKRIKEIELRKYYNFMEKIPFFNYGRGNYTIKNINDAFEEMIDILKDSDCQINEIKISLEDFIPESIIIKNGNLMQK